jgi:hypothetical protein
LFGIADIAGRSFSFGFLCAFGHSDCGEFGGELHHYRNECCGLGDGFNIDYGK